LLGEQSSLVSENIAFGVCKRGLSVAPEDAVGFAAGLVRLIDDAELRNVLAARARKFIEQHYSKERLLGDIGALYRELVHAEPVAVGVRQTSACR